MILFFIGTVITSVIVTLGIAYGGFRWYNKRLEAQAREATEELTKILKQQMRQEENDYMNKLHDGNNKGFLQ